MKSSVQTKFELVEEFKLDEATKKQIAHLLKVSFPEEEFHGRTYFKQLPHYRLLLKEEDVLIAQLGLDYRVMSLDGKPIKVLGIVDLTVLPTHQGRGFGTRLLEELCRIAEREKHNIDFLFLVADKHEFYEKCGFRLTKQKVKWLTIEQHVNYGLQTGEFTDCLMYKQIGEIKWTEGELDMLGYWY